MKKLVIVFPSGHRADRSPPVMLGVWASLIFILLAGCRSGAEAAQPPAPDLTPDGVQRFPDASLGGDSGRGFSPPASVTPPPSLPPDVSIPKALTATPDPYKGLRIEDLMARTYGGGVLSIHQQLDSEPGFSRFLISYPSDGIPIYGFMNVPVGAGPFPVVIALHGYIDPQEYETLDYTTRYADTISQAEFVVIHPNLRGYPPSGDGPNQFRVGMAIDVLNLIALVREHGGRPGALERTDPQKIGLWGHSMGGGITLRVLTISPHVGAAVLYGSMTADERKNYEMIYTWSEGARGVDELSVPEWALMEISPLYFLHQIRVPVSVHHGEEDDLIPVSESLELCERLEALSIRVNCYTYPSESHTFFGFGDFQFNQRTIDFFNQELKDRNRRER